MLLTLPRAASVLLASSLPSVVAEKMTILFDLWADENRGGAYKQIEVELGKCTPIPNPDILGDPGSSLQFPAGVVCANFQEKDCTTSADYTKMFTAYVDLKGQTTLWSPDWTYRAVICKFPQTTMETNPDRGTRAEVMKGFRHA